MEQRDQFGSRIGFVLAAIGFAVGLGNIWRFPYVAYENGGGAFLIPYLFALVTAGIPLVILEYTIGHKYRGSGPLSFFRIAPKAEWIGWWQVIVSFVVSTYYAVIIAWAIAYAYFSFGQKWGAGFDADGHLVTESFLNSRYLKLSGGEFELGGLTMGVFFPLILVWAVTMGILYRGVKRGIEIVNKIFMPLLVLLMLLIVIRGVTLPGAAEGLNALFKPDWSAMLNSKVWAAAYGQIFFSVGVTWSLFIVFASYLPKKSDISNNGFITALSNSGFELLAAIGVFATLGFLSVQMRVPVGEVAQDGVGLAFVIFPEIINQFPSFNGLFGFIFFFSLFIAGLSTLVSICEGYVVAIKEKFSLTRRQAVTRACGLSVLISILFATGGGLYFLDVVDYFMNNFGLAMIGLVETVFIAWIARKLNVIVNHANSVSEIQIGHLFKVCIGVVTPIVLGFIMLDNLRVNLTSLYGGYDVSFVITCGWGVAALAVVAAILFMRKGWPAAGGGEVTQTHFGQGKGRSL